MARFFPIDRRKPEVILSKLKFPFVEKLNIEDKGQIKATLIIDAQRLKMEDDDIEKIFTTLEIIEAEVITQRNKRIV